MSTTSFHHHLVDIRPSASAEELLDFTCATPWERLALDIELELRRWHLHDCAEPRPRSHPSAPHAPSSSHSVGGNGSGISHITAGVDHQSVTKSDVTPISSTPASTLTAPTTSSSSSPTPQPVFSSHVSFGHIKLLLQFFCSARTAFPHTFALERYFAVSTYVLLGPSDNESVLGDDETECSVYLSALCVAAQACQCTLPLFVPIGRPSTLRFLGRHRHQHQPHHHELVRYMCDFTHQRSHSHRHVAGLLSLFNSKRRWRRQRRRSNHQQQQQQQEQPVSLSSKTTTVAARFTYEWSDFQVRLPPLPDSLVTDRSFMAAHARALAESDPISLIRISAIWEPFPVSDLQRNDALAAMPAITASRLRLSLPSSVNSYVTCNPIRTPIAACARLNVRLAGKAKKRLGSMNPAAPLPLLFIGSPSSATTSKMTSISSSHVVLEGYLAQVGQYVEEAGHRNDSIDEEFLTSAIAALFETDLSGRGIMVDVVEALGPNASDLPLLERLARLIAVSESLQSAQQLWNLFLDGIQTLWEHRLTIPAIPFNPDTGPDHDASLVLQKLQMINCCTHRLRTKPRRHGGTGGARLRTGVIDIDDMGRKRQLPGVTLTNADGSDVVRSSNQAQMGLEDNAVWEPYVQPHPLVTRDMVEDELQRMVQRAEALKRRAEHAASGGPMSARVQTVHNSHSPTTTTSAGASSKRSNTSAESLKPATVRVSAPPLQGDQEDVQAKRQSLTLKSDMMAFKAANPKAVLADFVRWFSPSDWIEDDRGSGGGKQHDNDTVTQPGQKNIPVQSSTSTSKTGDVIDVDKDNNNDTGIAAEVMPDADKQSPGSVNSPSRNKQTRQRGRLSLRMSREGNIWEELWNGAESVAAHLQAPLFDAAAHGSKALADLRVMPLTRVFAHMSVIQGDSGVQMLLNGVRNRPHHLPFVERCVEGARLVIRRLGSKLPLISKSDLINNTTSTTTNVIDTATGVGTIDGTHLHNQQQQQQFQHHDVHHQPQQQQQHADESDDDEEMDALYNEMITELVRAEHNVLLATTLLMKLPPMREMARVVDALCQTDDGAHAHVDVERHDSRNRGETCVSMLVKIAGLDDPSWKSVVLPKGREFVLQADDGDRMFAQWGGDDFRVGLRTGVSTGLL